MIDDAPLDQHDGVVVKIAGVHALSVEQLLINRGVKPENIAEAKQLLASVAIPVTPEEAFEFSFRKPYGKGRFGAGQHPVLYTALEEGTSVAEVRYHRQKEVTAGGSSQGKLYVLLEAAFSGKVLNVLGREVQFPQLISPDDSGYPFCNQVAQSAISKGAAALHTRSAREPAGTCAPIFERAVLDVPKVIGRYTFESTDGQVVPQKIA